MGRFTRSARVACVLTAALTITGLAAAPAFAETGPNLKVTATVQQGRWLPGDDIPVEFTVTNLGDATANHVSGAAYTDSGPYFLIPDEEWGDLRVPGGTSFAPGESRTYHLHGSFSSRPEGTPEVEFTASGELDTDGSDNSVRVTVPLVPAGTTDRMGGHLYGDRDGDGKPSPGEDLAGAKVHTIGIGMSQEVVTTTDAAGRFAFEGLPVSRDFTLYFTDLPDGWVPPSSVGPLRLDGSGANTALEIKASRPLTDVLTETITLDKASYAVGATGTATVTLTNTGAKPLSGLYAGCDPAGSGLELDVPEDQWGAFGPLRHAGELAPGQRLVLKVSGKVPERAAYFGQTGLGCYIDGSGYVGGPYAYALAKVPGKKADAKGQVWTDKNGNGRPDAGEGVAKVKVTLSEDGVHVLSMAQTDANGVATFPQVGVGEYRLRPVGAWTASGDTSVSVVASPYGYGDWSLQVTAR
ncbi:SdrD B-like domain-containing protein [Amycolatopsis vastitatis]|uniref:SD-repeat containing protein B domain-containing protein n=1 Tax=Amycolatopsis vastitatis TaxID=1905142 RepID=A0A229SP44_9PSEU|nr:SdrD B-like domain-containing protein [Amycolatopsis vastitatis]OXM60628.1 hypothetical protein CF165_42130 [Amycolatopsis vastitatis]